MVSQSQAMSIARFYVYHLIDPRDGSVFYIGKGQGNRILAHESEAARIAEEACTKKHRRIKDIWQAGLKVERAQVAAFWREEDAFAHEASYIQQVGLKNLCNLMPGGGASRTGRFRRGRVAAPLQQPIKYWVLKWTPTAWMMLADWLGDLGGSASPKYAGKHWEQFIANGVERARKHWIPAIWREIKADPECLAVARQKLEPLGIRLD